MTALRGILALGLCTGLIVWAALSVARDMRLVTIEAGAEAFQAQKNAAELRARITGFEAGLTRAGPSLPTFVAADEAEAELLIQNRLLDLARTHQINPLSFGGAPLPEETASEAIGYSFEFETGHDQAFAYLEAVENSEPALALHGVWIRHLPVGSLGDVVTPVSMRLTLWAYWTPSDTNDEDGG